MSPLQGRTVRPNTNDENTRDGDNQGQEERDMKKEVLVNGGDEEVIEENREEEVEKPKTFPTPALPTMSELNEHRSSGRIPYRSWCNECVEGRGREMAHEASKKDGNDIAVIGFDYLFLDKTGCWVHQVHSEVGQ